MRAKSEERAVFLCALSGAKRPCAAYCNCAAPAFFPVALTFILTKERIFYMGFFDKLFGKADAGVNKNGIYAPVAGKAVPVEEVPDPTFSSGMLGGGIAIIPTDGKVCAPCDATVDMMFTTGHAVSLIADNGAEVLIHVGLETVGLGGKGFTIHAQNGQKVKKGDLLMEVDLETVKAAGLNTITPVLVCNSGDFSKFKTSTGKDVTNDDLVIELGK